MRLELFRLGNQATQGVALRVRIQRYSHCGRTVENKYEWNIVFPNGKVIELIDMRASIQEWFDARGGDGSQRKTSKKRGVTRTNEVDDLMDDDLMCDCLPRRNRGDRILAA